MQAKKTTQPAQIGISVVLLSLVMLFIGVSVTTRVVDEARDEMSRTESTAIFDTAEGNLAVEGDYKSGDTVRLSPDNDMLLLKKGETITLDLTAKDSYGNLDRYIPLSGGDTGYLLGQNNQRYIYFGNVNGDNTALLIRRIRTVGDATTAEQECYFSSSAPTGISCTRADDCGTGSNETFCAQNNMNHKIFQPGQNLSPTAGFKRNTDKIIIMALVNDTYIGFQGIAKHYRSASVDTAEGTARVVEQTETDPSAPGMFQFGIMVNGNITTE